jgi:SAM-dependent methyltransferase
MNSLDDSGAIFRYHRDMADWHGVNSSLALGWRSADDQLVRFEALAGIGDLDGKTVLDAGCGYGDLFAFLRSRYALSHYYGVEQIPELLEEALRRHWNSNHATFMARNFLNRELPFADYVFASGSLNYASSDPGYIYKAINTLFDHCRSGLAFNLLHTVAENGLLVAYEPELILDYCRTLSSRVEYRDGYAADDFTIWLYR